MQRNIVLVHQATITKYHRGWLINDRNLFLTVLVAGSWRSGGQHHAGSGERSLFQAADYQLLTVSSQW